MFVDVRLGRASDVKSAVFDFEFVRIAVCIARGDCQPHWWVQPPLATIATSPRHR